LLSLIIKAFFKLFFKEKIFKFKNKNKFLLVLIVVFFGPREDWKKFEDLGGIIDEESKNNYCK